MSFPRSLVCVSLGAAFAACASRTTRPAPAVDATEVATPAPRPVPVALAPAGLPVAPSAVLPAAAAPAPPVEAPRLPPAETPLVRAPYPTDLPALLARLAEDAKSGRDAELAGYADLLTGLVRLAPAAGPETQIVRDPELESQSRVAYPGARTHWATVSTYVESGADADAIRKVYLDFDRVPEWTGKPGTHTISRTPREIVGETDAIRKVLAFEYGARWHFRAHAFDRGEARLIATSMIPGANTRNMVSTRGVLIAWPDQGAVRVIEVATFAIEFEAPPLLRSTIQGTVMKEMHTRVAGMRGHWREYVARGK